jgi:hypothetical protein
LENIKEAQEDQEAEVNRIDRKKAIYGKNLDK